jgi:hypothetical protein
MNSENEIRALLQVFQAGYTRRDVSQVDAFMELFTTDAEVIGTNGMKPGAGEWYMDRASARELVEGDWEGWGDLRLDLDSMSVTRRRRKSRARNMTSTRSTGSVTNRASAGQRSRTQNICRIAAEI